MPQSDPSVQPDKMTLNLLIIKVNVSFVEQSRVEKDLLLCVSLCFSLQQTLDVQATEPAAQRHKHF